VLAALLNDQQSGRPDEYSARGAGELRAFDAAKIDATARQALAPEVLAIIVVGDRKQIDEQLATPGMEIEYLSTEEL
jgi:zinc protease